MILYLGMETSSSILKPAISVLPAPFKLNEWDLADSILLTFFSQESQNRRVHSEEKKDEIKNHSPGIWGNFICCMCSNPEKQYHGLTNTVTIQDTLMFMFFHKMYLVLKEMYIPSYSRVSPLPSSIMS